MILKKILYSPKNLIAGSVQSLYKSALIGFKNVLSNKGQAFSKKNAIGKRPANGIHILTVKDGHTLQCDGCGECQLSCPTRSISIRSDKKGPKDFEINYLKCIYCGLCVDVCPIDAIRQSGDQDFELLTKTSSVLGIKDLAFRSSLNAGKGIKA
jgi:formate hydrogenlyase subunit 6/NADH:ubiquinone oxidoreductase subunit I